MKRAQEFRDWFSVYPSNVKDFRAFDLAGDVLRMGEVICKLIVENAELKAALKEMAWDMGGVQPHETEHELATRIVALEKCLRDVGYEQLARDPFTVPGP